MVNRMLSALRQAAAALLCFGVIPIAARGQDTAAVKMIDPIGRPRSQASRAEPKYSPAIPAGVTTSAKQAVGTGTIDAARSMTARTGV